MNRINSLFENSKKKILSVYFTAGYPELNDTPDIIRELDKSGVDMIEIGMPFSDPVADGPVIQRSSEIALRNGMSAGLLFHQLSGVREYTDIPLLLMGYFNPIHKFGIEKFLEACNRTGIDGTIIPDLPVEEFKKSYDALFTQYGIINNFLISPQTPEERIIYLDGISKGFLYIVSTSSTTGGNNRFNQLNISYFKKIDDMNLKNPGLIGFGISDKLTYDQACEHSDGGIIGSAFIKALDENDSMSEKIKRFVQKIR